MGDRQYEQWRSIALALVAVLLYGRNGFGLPLSWDDNVWLVEDPALHDPWLALSSTHDNGYAPVLRLVIHAAVWLGGTTPAELAELTLGAQRGIPADWTGAWRTVVGLHSINLALFAASVVGLARLLSRLGVGATAAAVALTVWALHPTKVEPVVWITGLKDVLSLALLVGAASALVRADRGVWVGTTLGAAALLTKAAVFPVVFLLFALVAVREGWTAAARRVGPLSAIAVFLAVVGYYVFVPVSGHLPLPWSPPVDVLWVHGSFWSALWPVPRGAIVAVPADPTVPIAVGLIGTLGWAWLARLDRKAAFALALWLVPTLPYLGGVQMAFWAADRHLLIPSLGPALLLGWGVERAAQGPIRVGWLVVAAVCGAASWARVPAWHDSVALWEADVQRPGDHWARWYKLGMERAKGGDMLAAERAFDRSLSRNPDQRAVLAAYVLAALARDGWTAEDRQLAAGLHPPPADDAAWREMARILRQRGATELASRVESFL